MVVLRSFTSDEDLVLIVFTRRTQTGDNRRLSVSEFRLYTGLGNLDKSKTVCVCAGGGVIGSTKSDTLYFARNTPKIVSFGDRI